MSRASRASLNAVLVSLINGKVFVWRTLKHLLKSARTVLHKHVQFLLFIVVVGVKQLNDMCMVNLAQQRQFAA